LVFQNELLNIILKDPGTRALDNANRSGITKCGTKDVACVIDAKHLCVNSRGISDIESSTVTSELVENLKTQARREFLDYILETKF
jgi:GTP cyclohydrolase I